MPWFSIGRVSRPETTAHLLRSEETNAQHVHVFDSKMLLFGPLEGSNSTEQNFY